MTPEYLELFVEQGEDFSANISLIPLRNAGYNLHAFSAKSEIRRSFASEYTSAEFIPEIYPETNRMTISLDACATENLSAGRYVYDIFLISSETYKRIKIRDGLLFVEPSATRL